MHTTLRRAIAITTLALLTACSSKYPYPPQYVDSHTVSARSIPQPPAQGSAEYKAEVAQIVALQARLSPQEIAAIKREDKITPDKMLYPVLGEHYNEVRYPKLYEFLRKVASDSWRIGDDARDYWKSPRPWYTESAVKLHVEPIYSYGYPSGHTTTFGSWAYVLADLFPQHGDAFFAHAWSVAEHRIGGGAHYPHDIRGGKMMAAAVYSALQHNADYRRDLAEVLAEIKATPAAPSKKCNCLHGKKKAGQQGRPAYVMH